VAITVLAVGALTVVGAIALFGSSGRPPPANAAIVLPPVPAPVTPTVPVPQPLTDARRARCPATSVACVDLVAHEAWLQRDGRIVLAPVPILPGAETGLRPAGPTSSATPVGTFRVQRKKADEFSEEFHEPMPHAVYFAPGGIAFHEGSLSETSNGCVHLDPVAARLVFDDLRVGDRVTVW
jgi:hypothetical protein